MGYSSRRDAEGAENIGRAALGCGDPRGGGPTDGTIDWAAFLASALKAGVTVLDFWRMNPAEVVMAIKAANWREKQELQRALYGAWHVEAFARMKRLPSLKRLLRSDEEEKPDFEQLKRDFFAVVGRSKVAKGRGNPDGSRPAPG